MPVVLLEPGMYNAMLNQAQRLSMSATMMTSNLVRHHLPSLNYLSKDHAPMVSEYALLDFIKGSETISNPRPALIELVEARIWPTLEGTLQSRKEARCLLLFRNEWESLLFHTCRPEVTLQLDRLTDPVLRFLRTHVVPTDILVRYRSLTDLGVDWSHLLPSTTGLPNAPLIRYEPQTDLFSPRYGTGYQRDAITIMKHYKKLPVVFICFMSIVNGSASWHQRIILFLL